MHKNSFKYIKTSVNWSDRNLIDRVICIIEPQIQLLLEVRRITLKDETPGAFMSLLLALLRFADTLHNSEDPLLGRYYNETKYRKLKLRLNEILRNKGIKV